MIVAENFLLLQIYTCVLRWVEQCSDEVDATFLSKFASRTRAQALNPTDVLCTDHMKYGATAPALDRRDRSDHMTNR